MCLLSVAATLAVLKAKPTHAARLRLFFKVSKAVSQAAFDLIRRLLQAVVLAKKSAKPFDVYDLVVGAATC